MQDREACCHQRMWKEGPHVMRCISVRARWAVFVTVFLLFLSYSRVFSGYAADVETPSQHDVAPQLELSPFGGDSQSPNLHPEAQTPGNSHRSNPRRGSPRSDPPLLSSPAKAREALSEIRKRLPKGTPTTDAKVVHDWIGEKLLEGKVSPKDLMKSVIAVTSEGRKWTDGAISSTKSDVLRRISNTLNFSTGELQDLVRATKNDPVFHKKDTEMSPEPSQISEIRSPSPSPQSTPQRPPFLDPVQEESLDTNGFFRDEPESPPLRPDVSPFPRQVSDVPASPNNSADDALSTRSSSTPSLLAGDQRQPDTGSVDENLPGGDVARPARPASVYSPEVAELLANIEPLPYRQISDDELLAFSPYAGPQPRWVPEDPKSGSTATNLHEENSEEEMLRARHRLSFTEDVDDIIAALQTPSIWTPVDTQGPFFKDAGTEIEAMAPPKTDAGTEMEEMHLPPGKTFQDPTDESVRTDNDTPLIEHSTRLEPQRSRRASMFKYRPGSFDQSTRYHLTFPKRSWEMTKAVGREHKGKLKVAGAVVLAAAIIAGLAVAHKKIRRRIPIANPLLTTVEAKKCHVLIDFEKGHRANGMGEVATVEGVVANNPKRILTVTFTERPAIRSSRGSDILKWLKYRITFGRALARREEKLAFPETCMAGKHSGFEVAEKDGRVLRLLVDLDLNPGPLTVPRKVLESHQISKMLSGFERDPVWRLYDDCIMHITIEKPFTGSPLVQVETARGRVSFQNPELQHFSSPLPRECEWREPWKLRLVYKSDGSLPLDLLLMMSAADTPVTETEPLRRMPGNATLDDLITEDEMDDFGLTRLFGDE